MCCLKWRGILRRSVLSEVVEVIGCLRRLRVTDCAFCMIANWLPERGGFHSIHCSESDPPEPFLTSRGCENRGEVRSLLQLPPMPVLGWASTWKAEEIFSDIHGEKGFRYRCLGGLLEYDSRIIERREGWKMKC